MQLSLNYKKRIYKVAVVTQNPTGACIPLKSLCPLLMHCIHPPMYPLRHYIQNTSLRNTPSYPSSCA